MKEHKLPLTSHGVSFAYDKKQVLKNISADFYHGTFYGIAGPNGSGKTTWLKVMAGLLSNYEGHIKTFENDITKLKAIDLAKHVSYVPQMFQIPYAFSIEDVVAMGRYPYIKTHGRNKNDDDIIKETLEETNLLHIKDRPVNSLSGGELQRVIIARAIAQDTNVILLDEPISHLDIHYQHDIIETLKGLCRKKNKTVISVLHELNVTLNHCDHVFLLKDGSVMTQGEPHQVLTADVVRKVYDINVTIVESNNQKMVTW